MAQTKSPDFVAKKKIYQIEIDGEVYEMRKPLYSEAKEIRDRSKNLTDEDAVDRTIDELVKLGAPEDMGEKVDTDDILEIAQIVLGSGKKKITEHELIKCKLAHWYGWTDDYIESLDYETAIKYLIGSNALEARKYMYQSNIVLLPKLKRDNDRKKWFQGLKQTIYDSILTREGPITYGELKAKLAGARQDGR